MWINWLLASGFVTSGIYLFWALPLWLLPADPLWGLTLIPLALLTNTYWALAHETFHGSFCKSATNNVVVGRILCMLFGSPYHLLRLGHLLHHGFNRTSRERVEVYDPSQTSWGRAALSYYAQLLGGLYWQEFLSVFLFLLPRSVILRLFTSPSQAQGLLPAMAKKLTVPSTLRAVRLDSLAIIAVFGSALWAYGGYAWMLLLLLAARAFLISFADYVYHYDTPLDDVPYGRNLRLPSLPSALLLHFNLHGVHHHQPLRPWHQLPQGFRELNASYSDAMLPALAKQLRGPLPLPHFKSKVPQA